MQDLLPCEVYPWWSRLHREGAVSASMDESLPRVALISISWAGLLMLWLLPIVVVYRM